MRTVKRMRDRKLGDFLTDLAWLIIIASAILKITYKRTIQAEVKAAVATETADSEQLKRQVVEARMAAMQAQVEPHFLFNTLASIDHLIETDPPRASTMQKNLIALLRASMPSMRESNPTQHALGREMAVIRPYLEILKVRMEDRLQPTINVPEGLLSAEFPPMMIQSLVENAIKHGLEPKAEGGTLTVSAEIVHGRLAVTVADTGLGFGRADTAGTGIGLANIRERLKLLYGDKASMVVADNLPSGTIVTITVPYQALQREGDAIVMKTWSRALAIALLVLTLVVAVLITIGVRGSRCRSTASRSPSTARPSRSPTCSGRQVAVGLCIAVSRCVVIAIVAALVAVVVGGRRRRARHRLRPARRVGLAARSCCRRSR